MRLAISFNNEIMLCKETINNSYNGVIAEYNFLVPKDTVEEVYEKWFKGNKYESFEEFLDIYDPDFEGDLIYHYCKAQGVVKYEDWNPVDWEMEDLEEQMQALKEE